MNASEELPPGWVKRWDARYNRHYFVDTKTGVPQWVDPRKHSNVSHRSSVSSSTTSSGSGTPVMHNQPIPARTGSPVGHMETLSKGAPGNMNANISQICAQTENLSIKDPRLSQAMPPQSTHVSTTNYQSYNALVTPENANRQATPGFNIQAQTLNQTVVTSQQTTMPLQTTSQPVGMPQQTTVPQQTLNQSTAMPQHTTMPQHMTNPPPLTMPQQKTSPQQMNSSLTMPQQQITTTSPQQMTNPSLTMPQQTTTPPQQTTNSPLTMPHAHPGVRSHSESSTDSPHAVLGWQNPQRTSAVPESMRPALSRHSTTPANLNSINKTQPPPPVPTANVNAVQPVAAYPVKQNPAIPGGIVSPNIPGAPATGQTQYMLRTDANGKKYYVPVQLQSAVVNKNPQAVPAGQPVVMNGKIVYLNQQQQPVQQVQQLQPGQLQPVQVQQVRQVQQLQVVQPQAIYNQAQYNQAPSVFQQKLLSVGKEVGKAAARLAAYSIAPGSEKVLFKNNNNNQQQQMQMQQQRQLQLQLQLQQQQLLQLQQQQLLQQQMNQGQPQQIQQGQPVVQYQVINGVTYQAVPVNQGVATAPAMQANPQPAKAKKQPQQQQSGMATTILTNVIKAAVNHQGSGQGSQQDTSQQSDGSGGFDLGDMMGNLGDMAQNIDLGDIASNIGDMFSGDD